MRIDKRKYKIFIFVICLFFAISFLFAVLGVFFIESKLTANIFFSAAAVPFCTDIVLYFIFRKDLKKYEIQKTEKQFEDISLTKLNCTVTAAKMSELLLQDKYREKGYGIFKKTRNVNCGDFDAVYHYHVKIVETAHISADGIEQLASSFEAGFDTYNAAVFFVDRFTEADKESICRYIKHRLVYIINHRYKSIQGFSPIVIELDGDAVYFFKHKSFTVHEFKEGTNQVIDLLQRNLMKK